MVENYWIELRCFRNTDISYEVRVQLKKSDAVFKLCKKLHEKFTVLESQLTRLWTFSYERNFLIILHPNRTIEEEGLYSSQVVILEVQVNGYWMTKDQVFGHFSRNAPMFRSGRSMFRTPSGESKRMDDSSKNRSSSTDEEAESVTEKFKKVTLNVEYANKRRIKGLCGLVNLGNTCYMNSVVQCLSNCPSLTEYFIKNCHVYEINKDNPLGTNGEMAKVYGELIKSMWEGNSNCVKPIHLKSQVSRFNPLFRGWSQHDAQEFLSFLLTGLHEDLKRTGKQQNKEDKEENDIMSIENSDLITMHKTKDDSIIVDSFYGMLKSSVICPKCERLSVTYDPFSTLSLPLPLHKFRSIKVNFIPNDPSEIVSSLNICLPYKSLFKDLLSDISYRKNSKERLLVPAEVTDYHVQRIYTQHEKINNDEIYVYELHEKAADAEYSVIPVCFWNLKSNSDKISLTRGFGIPLLVTFKKSDLAQGKIGACIIEHVRKRFKFEEDFVPEMYVLDLSNKHFADAIELNISDDGICRNDIIQLLELNKSERLFDRKMLFVNVPLTGNEPFFKELSSSGKEERVEKLEKLTIYDCLELFTAFEKLDPDNLWYCSSCRSKQRATKKFDFWNLPKVLVLHLKRFSASSLSSKLQHHVSYPLQGLNLSGVISNPAQKSVSYDLFGVVNHYGTLSGGHYTACCKNADTDKWFLFDDSHVTHIEPERVVASSAYLLFYKER